MQLVFFTPDYVAHLTDQEMTGGQGAVRTVLAMYRSAFSDLRVEVEILVEGSDRVAWQRTLRATHDGDFKGSRPPVVRSCGETWRPVGSAMV